MTKRVTEEYLKTIPLFSDLSQEELAELIKIVSLRKYPKGAILYYEKEKHNEIYYLKEGLIKIYKVDRFDNEVFMYNLFSDTLISEITDFDRIGCFANAEFAIDSDVLVIDFEHFQQMYMNSPNLMLKLLKEFAKKSKMMQCIINREIVFDGTAKVAFMLINDLRSFNQLKKQEIAYMLNIQPETLSRILKKLTRSGMIDTVDGETVLKDEATLREIFE
ncbi:Crp/Fnr family transcriptional regulator [Sulfurimonas sp. HSL1-2]|uniref:Crp/Fnr family transcriptional regulator n=1 Tax=Thiomicrolovo zhangzhouensis TaxID=3131933 RepID=UPI0031F86EBF